MITKSETGHDMVNYYRQPHERSHSAERFPYNSENLVRIIHYLLGIKQALHAHFTASPTWGAQERHHSPSGAIAAQFLNCEPWSSLSARKPVCYVSGHERSKWIGGWLSLNDTWSLSGLCCVNMTTAMMLDPSWSQETKSTVLGRTD
jgi:hypothetical protein